jgi:hypothetical protein
MTPDQIFIQISVISFEVSWCRITNAAIKTNYSENEKININAVSG